MTGNYLTKSEKRTLDFIELYFEIHGMAPTTQEIADGINIQSRGVVHRYLKSLQEQGFLDLEPQKKRNIRLKKQVAANTALPLIGKIAAGLPIEALSQHDTFDVGVLLGANRYALRVEGDSMIDEGIWDGDVVICEHAEQARSGLIVVALVDHEAATLKRIYYNSDKTITLAPANVKHKPQVYAGDRITIQGIFVGLLRFPGGSL